MSPSSSITTSRVIFDEVGIYEFNNKKFAVNLLDESESDVTKKSVLDDQDFNKEIRYFNDIAKKALVWTRRVLKSNQDHWEYVKELPLTKHVKYQNLSIFTCHATPYKPEEWEYFYYYRQEQVPCLSIHRNK